MSEIKLASGEVEARARKIYDDLCGYAERNFPHVNDSVNAKIAVLREVLDA